MINDGDMQKKAESTLLMSGSALELRTILSSSYFNNRVVDAQPKSALARIPSNLNLTLEGSLNHSSSGSALSVQRFLPSAPTKILGRVS
jgi:hypothetical protein